MSETSIKKKKKHYCFCFFICNESGRKGVVIVFELKLLNLLHPDILRKSPGFIIFKCCSLKPCPQLLSMWVHFRYILVYLWQKDLVFWGLLGWSASPFPYLFYFSFSLRRNKTIWEMINALWFSDNNKTSHGNEKLWSIYPASQPVSVRTGHSCILRAGAFLLLRYSVSLRCGQFCEELCP